MERHQITGHTELIGLIQSATRSHLQHIMQLTKSWVLIS